MQHKSKGRSWKQKNNKRKLQDGTSELAFDAPMLVILSDSPSESCEDLADAIANENKSIWRYDPTPDFHINNNVIGQGGNSIFRKKLKEYPGVFHENDFIFKEYFLVFAKS